MRTLRPLLALALLTFTACPGDDGASDTGLDDGTAGDSSTSADTTSADTTSADTTSADTTSADTTSAGTDSDTGFVPTVGDGVFLFTGSGGNNWDTDAAALEMVYANAGVAVTRSDTISADITATHGCLLLLNPTTTLAPAVVDAAQAMVDGGGRVVLQTEHSDYGGHDIANALLTSLGATMRSVADSRGGWVDLDLTPAPPLTDGVSALAPFYVARVELGASGQAVAKLVGEEWVVISREAVSHGEVVIVSDGSMFGYSLAEGDNQQFMLNLAAH